MNTAMQICQTRYDAMLPPEPVDTEEAERIWVDNAACDLLDGQDVKFQCRMRSFQVGLAVALVIGFVGRVGGNQRLGDDFFL